MGAGIGVAAIWIVCGTLAYHHERVKCDPGGIMIFALIATLIVAAGASY